MTELPDYGAEARMPAEAAIPLPQVLTRWWAWCLVAGGAMLGLSFVGNLVDYQHYDRAGLRLVLSPLLGNLSRWSFLHGVETATIVLALAAVGGIGWQAERRERGDRPWAGAWLTLYLVLAPQIVNLVVRVFFPMPERGSLPTQGADPPESWSFVDATEGTEPLLALSVFAPVLLWAWVMSRRREHRSQALRLALLLGGVGVAIALAGVGLDKVEGGRTLGQAVYYMLPLGFLPAVVLMQSRLWRKSALMPGLALAAGFFLASGLAMPQMVSMDRPPRVTPHSDAGEAAEETHLIKLVSLGERSFSHFGQSSTWDGFALGVEGLADTEQGRGQGNWARDSNLWRDRANLDVARAYFRVRLTEEPTLKEAIAYIKITATDPLASQGDRGFLPVLPALIPHEPGLATQLAAAMYARGEVALGDNLLRQGQGLEAGAPLPEKEIACPLPRGIEAAGGAAATEGRDCPAWWSPLGRALFQREWPLFAPPYDGAVTVTWDTGSFTGLGNSLMAAAIPLHEPTEPNRTGGETHGEWSQEGLVRFWPLEAGVTELAPLPAGQYALQVGYQDYLHPGLEVWVSGLPTEPLVLGPGTWRWETELVLLPEEPVVPRCEGGVVRWPPYPGAAAYKVEVYGGRFGIGSWLMAADAEEESLGILNSMLQTTGRVLGWIRVVPVDAQGNPLVLALPLSQEAEDLAMSRALAIMEECSPKPLSEEVSAAP